MQVGNIATELVPGPVVEQGLFPRLVVATPSAQRSFYLDFRDESRE